LNDDPGTGAAAKRMVDFLGLDWKPGRVETNRGSADVKMKNESIFQRKRERKVIPFFPRSFHFHTFIHFFLSCLRNEIPKDIFFSFLNGMESKFTFGVIIFIAADPIDPNFRK